MASEATVTLIAPSDGGEAAAGVPGASAASVVAASTAVVAAAVADAGTTTTTTASTTDDDGGGHPFDDMPAVGDFFIDKDYTVTSFDIGGHIQKVKTLQAASTDYDLTGQVVWPASQVMAHYLRHVADELVRGCAAVELGAGSGLSGLYATHLAANVVLTDGIDEPVELLQDNLQFAGSDCKTTVLKLEWGDVDHERQACEAIGGGLFDVVIGADCCFPFSRDAIPNLFVSASRLGSATAPFLVSLSPRSESIMREVAASAAAAGYEDHIIPNDEFLPTPLPADLAGVDTGYIQLHRFERRAPVDA